MKKDNWVAEMSCEFQDGYGYGLKDGEEEGIRRFIKFLKKRHKNSGTIDIMFLNCDLVAYEEQKK